jgi:regulator of protease activity HflC (stomatin/prohibitin superfamily)
VAEEPKNPVPDQPASEPTDAQPAFDEASASLADALRTSFTVLTVIIFVLLAVFLLQGIFTVQSDQKAIVLRFGAYEEGRVMDQGIHYAFPYPIDRVVPIWVRPRKLEVNTFWRKMSVEAKDQRMEKGGEPPKPVEGAEDAVMLTGDLNMLQAQWDVTYRIRSDSKAVVEYYRTIGEGKTGELNETRLVRGALQSAAIRETSAMKVFDIYPRNKEVLVEAVKKSLGETLDKLECGLEVERVTLRELRPPEQVRQAFDNVLATTQAMAEFRVSTNREREKALIETAGEVGIQLGDDIAKWWTAKDAARAAALRLEKIRAGNDLTGADEAQADLEKATKEMQDIETGMSKTFQDAGGQVQTILADARTYQSLVVESAKGDRSTMDSLLKNPAQIKVFLDHARVDALQEVLNACYEKYYYNAASDKAHRLLELWLNRRPELIRAATKPIESR